MRSSLRARRVAACVVSLCLLGAGASSASAADLDLETLTGEQAEQMMESGELTSVQLTKAYIARINALNKRGPGLNAVTQLNKHALEEAALADQQRAAGTVLGPAHGLPILLKDLIDVKDMYTSAGNWSLRNSYPADDAPMVKVLRAHGVIILGKLGLSEYANSFGNQPSGFANLTGQVLNGIDADQNPSGSSSGTGAAMAAAMSTLGIGTETSGSIISPSSTQSLVGLRPTVGLVPATGIAPISASQDTAGPMVRSVSDAAMTMASIAGPDPESGYADEFGAANLDDVIPPLPPTIPDYMSALDLTYVQGKRIGYTGGTPAAGTPARIAFDALVAAGATMVPKSQVNPSGLPSLPAGYEQHMTIDAYYAHLGPNAPIKSLDEEIADNLTNPMEALKFGNGNHLNAAAAPLNDANKTAYQSALRTRKMAWHKSIDDMLTNETSDPADDVIAILGSVSNGPQAGYPTITIPMGYVAPTRRAQNVQVTSGAYRERDLIGIGYVIEQATQLRQPASMVSPSMYRCAKTVPLPPFASRGACNPDYDTIMAAVGTAPTLGFSLETASIDDLQSRLNAGTLTSEALTKAYLSRIALSNAEGPATQAVRSVNLAAIGQARAADQERAVDGSHGPLFGIPVLVDDSIDVAGVPTTAGSIALQLSTPTADSRIVARLRASGAIILGKTNVSELNGLFDGNMPEGYSSLGGQVLLPSDTDKTVAGSSGGAAAATASGLAAATVGLETSTDTAQLIAPAGVAGVVGLKPTVGRVSRTGVLGVARSQDAPGPIGKSVYDVAAMLQVISVRDPADEATQAPANTPTDYVSGLRATALNGKRVAVVSSSTAPYPDAVAAVQNAGATTVVVTPGTPTSVPSIVTREFKRDLNAYLGTVPGPGAKTLQEIIAYNAANAAEGLKYQQGELIAAQAIDVGSDASYPTDRDTGKAANAAVLDAVFNNGTPGDATDDNEVVMVPSGNGLVAIADRAGYPVLTVPAGYGTGSAGRNPIGVTFIAPAFAEARLLADAYAFEQATRIRLAPSVTNPSMWRCVTASSFFSPHQCHPGDRLYGSPFTETAPPVTPPIFSTTDTTVPEDTGAPVQGSGASGAATPAATTPAPTPAGKAADEDADQRKALARPVKNTLSSRSVLMTDTFVEAGRVTYVVTLERPGGVTITLGKATARVTKDGTVKVRLTLTKAGRKALKRYPKAEVELTTTFVSGPTGKTMTTTRTLERS